MPVGEFARRHGVVENSIYRWKSKLDRMELSDAKRLRELEPFGASTSRWKVRGDEN